MVDGGDEPGATGSCSDIPFATPSLEDMQHWTGVIGRAQQMMLEHATDAMLKASEETKPQALSSAMSPLMLGDPAKIAKAQADFWHDSLALWQRFLKPSADAQPHAADRDRR